MINLVDVTKTYRMGGVEVHALIGVTLGIRKGEFIAIMGPSGSGKSTLMHILGLLDLPDSGSYDIMGRDVIGMNEEALADCRSRTIGFVFQQFNLLARLSALENVALPQLYSGNGRDPGLAARLLAGVGLSERMRHRPNELSGGQQQRVAIARALINEPLVILADEPTGNLDSQSEREIMGLLTGLNERGMTVIVVTHEEEIAKRARRIIRMRDGKIFSDDDKVLAQENGDRAKGRGQAAFPKKSSLAPKQAMVYFGQAARSLLANKVRTGLSLLGILIGVAAVIAMLALGRGAQKSIEERLASMGTNLLVLRPGSRAMRGVALESGSVARFTKDDAQEIARSVVSARRVSPTVSGRGQAAYGNKNWSTQIMGATPEYAPVRAAVPVLGRFFDDYEERKRARVAVLGMTVARELFGQINPIGEFIKINRINFQVIGILLEKGATSWRDQDDMVVIPLSTAMRRLMGKDFVDAIDIEIASSQEMEEAAEEIKALIIRNHRLPPSQQDGFEVRNMEEMQAALSETSRTMTLLLACVAAISLLVGGIGIMNIMLVSVTERTREIGLRKAIGAKRRDILAQFLIEAVAVSLAGGLLGIILGWLITIAMSRFAGWAASVTLSSIMLASVFSAVVGVVFGLWPAAKASALRPIEALRYE